jgi:hypothetical protein
MLYEWHRLRNALASPLKYLANLDMLRRLLAPANKIVTEQQIVAENCDLENLLVLRGLLLSTDTIMMPYCSRTGTAVGVLYTTRSTAFLRSNSGSS